MRSKKILLFIGVLAIAVIVRAVKLKNYLDEQAIEKRNSELDNRVISIDEAKRIIDSVSHPEKYSKKDTTIISNH